MGRTDTEGTRPGGQGLPAGDHTLTPRPARVLVHEAEGLSGGGDLEGLGAGGLAWTVQVALRLSPGPSRSRKGVR